MAGALRGPIAKPAGERDDNRVSLRMKPITAFEGRMRPQPAWGPSSFKNARARKVKRRRHSPAAAVPDG